jgi:hypothetical protein
MRLRKGVASLVLVPAVMLAMLGVGASSASAVSVDRVTGGEFALFVPLENVSQLAHAGLFTTPIAPAYLTFRSLEEGPALRFPISGGTLESATMLGTVDSQGGMTMERQFPDGTSKKLDITNVRILNGNMLVGNVLGLVPAPSADLVNATHSKDRATGVIHYEADARINLVTATVLNTYFSTDFFKDGFVLGRVKGDIETETLLGL